MYSRCIKKTIKFEIDDADLIAAKNTYFKDKIVSVYDLFFLIDFYLKFKQNYRIKLKKKLKQRELKNLE